MRKSILSIYIVALALMLQCAGFSDQTLTITLDPPKNESQSDLRLKHETLGATQNSSAKVSTQYRTEVNAASKQASTKETPVGRVGTVVASNTDIMRVPAERGYSLFRCPKDTYLAIVGEHKTWYGVLMIDGSTGWVEKSKVKLLDFQVLGPAVANSEFGSKVVQTALKYLGIPYKWGGYSGSGIDCSGFVKAVFASHGIQLPRVSRDQANVGAPVPFDRLQAGDRLYFSCKGEHVDHTGIYMGNGLFIHSSVGNNGVAVDSISKPFYAKSLVVARRS